nr:nuclease [Sulfuracidifex metallicus]
MGFKYSVAGRVYFVLSIDKEDKFRVLTALQVMNLYKKGIAKLDSFENGAKTPYFLISRDQWKPFRELIVGIKNWYSTISEEFMYRVSGK